MSENDMHHGNPDESGTRFWCQSCKTYVPEPEWDHHEEYHGPENRSVDTGADR